VSRIVQRLRYRLELRRLAARPGVTIAPDAQVSARTITMKPGCQLRVDARSIVEAVLDFERVGAVITVGANSYVGASIFKCAERIDVGDNVEIAWNCSIVDHDWESMVWEQRAVDMREWYRSEKNWTHVPVAPVRIGDKAVIGFNSIILKGVTVGEGSVVGVGSVVTRDVPPYTVVAGSPARVIRRLEATGSARPSVNMIP